MNPYLILSEMLLLNIFVILSFFSVSESHACSQSAGMQPLVSRQSMCLRRLVFSNKDMVSPNLNINVIGSSSEINLQKGRNK